MACTATIQSIILCSDGSDSGINYQVRVLFNDPTSGYAQSKVYTFSGSATILADKAVIQADLNTIKVAINTVVNLQSLVGTTLT